MSYEDGFRLWFIILYVIGTASFVIMVIQMRPKRNATEEQEGSLASAGILIPVRREEELLNEKFGSEYNEYSEKASRFFRGFGDRQ